MSYIDDMSYAINLLESTQELEKATVEAVALSGRIPLALTLGNAITLNAKTAKMLVTSAIKDFRIMADETYDMIDFFEKIYVSPKLDQLPLTTVVYNTALINGIKPNYLQQVPNDTSFALNSFYSGKLSAADIKQKYTSKEYIESRKKLVVKNAPNLYNADVKTLTNINDTDAYVTSVNAEMISSVILPFLRNIPQKLKEFELLLGNLLTAIDNGKDEYIAMAKTIDGKIDGANTLKGNMFPKQYLIVSMKIFVNVYTYVENMMFKEAMLCRKNIESFKDLQNKILRYYPEGVRALHESVFDGDMKDMDADGVVISLLNNDNSFFRAAIERVRSEVLGDISYATGKKYYADPIDGESFATAPYNLGIQLFSQVEDSFNIINATMTDSYISFNELLTKANLNTDSLVGRFSSYIAKIDDMSNYDEVLMNHPSNEDMSILLESCVDELNYAGPGIDLVAKKIYQVFGLYKEIMTRLEQLDNTEFGNMELADELYKFMDNIDSQYKQLILVVINAYVKRITALSTVIKRLSDVILVNPDISVDNSKPMIDPFEELALSSIIDIYMNTHTHVLEKYSMEIQAHRMYLETGVRPIYEEDEKLATSANATNDDKKDDKPATASSTEKKSAGEVIDTIINRIKSFFTKSTEMVQEIIDKQKGNVKTLEKNRDAIINQNFDGMQVNVLPYEKYINEDQIKSDVRSVISKVKAFNPSDTNLTTRDGVTKYLFSFMGNKLNSNNINEYSKTYYKVKEGKLQLATYNGSAIKPLAPIMIDYCISYYTTFGTELMAILNELMKATTDKIESLENINESTLNLFGEADEVKKTTPSVKTDGSKAETNTAGDEKKVDKMTAIKILSSAIQSYAAGVLGATRDRNYDYLKIIQSITPKAKEEPAKETEETDTTS